MARIQVQTDDCRTVLDELNVQLANINNEAAWCVELLDRLERAIQDSERRRGGSRRRVRHPAAIVPATDYRSVRG